MERWPDPPPSGGPPLFRVDPDADARRRYTLAGRVLGGVLVYALLVLVGQAALPADRMAPAWALLETFGVPAATFVLGFYFGGRRG